MKKLFLAALAALFCSAPAVAQTIPKTTVVFVKVVNNSDTCAWVTIYWARLYTPWTIEGSPEARPRFVNLHSTYTFPVRFTNPTSIPLPAEIKVRAEYTRYSNCSGGTKEDHDAYNKGIVVDKNILGKVDVTSFLSGPPYRVSDPR